MTKPMPQTATFAHFNATHAFSNAMTSTQTVNGGQPLKCTAPDGSVCYCRDSQIYNTDPTIARNWKKTTKSIRKNRHDRRTNGYALCRMQDGTLYPMINYIEFMMNPYGAIKKWQTIHGIKPVKRKPIWISFPRRHKICGMPRTIQPSP